MARILFLVRHFGCLRNYEQVLVRLAKRGHSLHLAAVQRDDQGGERLVARLVARSSNIRTEAVPWTMVEARNSVATRLRLASDYLRYLDPLYADTPRLRLRARQRTPVSLLWLLRMPGVASTAGRRVLLRVLRGLERAVPIRRSLEEFFCRLQPDLVFFSPLIGLGSPEVDYLLCARGLGLRTIFGVWSWDNLSSKSFLRAIPDAVLVWNNIQRREAIEWHGVPAERIVVTGAPKFDNWFKWEPRQSREEFCARIGLPANRPIVMWVCSALLAGSPIEADFVRRWVERIRRCGDPKLRDAGILVRPHPSRMKEWQVVSLAGLPNTVLWGGNPIDEGAWDDYGHSLCHSDAVVGLNTSAMLDAAVLAKPVLTIMPPAFTENQEGTLHFRYLLEAEGGWLHTSRGLDEHLTQLSALLGDADAGRASRAFALTFLKPQGMEKTATDILADTVDQVLTCPPQTSVIAAGGAIGAAGVWILEQIARLPVGRILLADQTQRTEERGRARQIRRRRWQERWEMLSYWLGRMRLLCRSPDYRRDKLNRFFRRHQV